MLLVILHDFFSIVFYERVNFVLYCKKALIFFCGLSFFIVYGYHCFGAISCNKVCLIYGNVFDLTNWITKHPGGATVIRAICGKDGSDAFEGQHAGQGKPANQLSNYYLGKLGDSVKL